MKKHRFIWVMGFLALALEMGWAQSDSGQQPADSSQQPSTTPAPAFGQDNPPPASGENPPISGLDQPSLEPRAAARSFFIPGAHVSEAVDSNVGNSAGGASLNEVTRALGSLTLQRLWSRYDLALDYVGGGAFYSKRSTTAAQMHQFDTDQRILWRTGQLAIRDSFSYLPEGSFGYGSYGGVGAVSGIGGMGGGLAGGGLGTFFGSGQFAALGQQPRIANVGLADITESLNPRSSVTLAGSYGLVHFTNNALGFVNSRQISAQAGYNYQINRKDQVALVYGFQAFRYPGSGNRFNTSLLNVLWGHRITGRMDLVLGGGPQLTRVHTCITPPLSTQCVLVSNTRLSGSGRASLRYRFTKTSVSLAYDHYNTSGSGFFTGAKSDVARLTATRPLSRKWDATADIGFTHSTRIAPSQIGISALSYDYLYAGAAAHRQLGRNFSFFFSYQFNDLGFDNSFCAVGTHCNRISQRHVGSVGLDWHPHPIRLD